MCECTAKKPSDKAKTALLHQLEASVVFQILQTGALCCHQIGEKLGSQHSLYMMSSKLLAFKLEKKISRSQEKKFKLFLEQTFLIFWGEWLIVRKLVTQLNKQMNNLGSEKREEGALWSHWRKVCSPLQWRFSSWTTFLSPYPHGAFDRQFSLLFLATCGAPHTSQTLQAQQYFTASLAPPAPGNHNPHRPEWRKWLWFPSTFHTSNGEGERRAYAGLDRAG